MTKIPQEFKPNGYNPSTGVYASSYIFTGDWEDELRALDYTPRTRQFDEVSSTDEEKGLHSGYLYNSFASQDGKSTTHDVTHDFWT